MKMVETWYESLILFIALLEICNLRVVYQRFVPFDFGIENAFKHVNKLYLDKVCHA